MKRFSRRLAEERRVSDSEVTAVLGEGGDALPYLLHTAAGRRRKVTGEPAACHGADCGLITRDLGFDPHVVRLSILHDTVEDCARSLEDVTRLLQEVSELFGAAVAADLRLLTNRYAIIADGLQLSPDDAALLEDCSVALVRRALAAHVRSINARLREEFAAEHVRLDAWLADPGCWQRWSRGCLDASRSLAEVVRLLSYIPFLQEINDEAKNRLGERGFYEAVVIVKSIDVLDNMRTLTVSDFHSIKRAVFKTQAFLDCSFHLHAHIARTGAHTAFVSLYDYVKTAFWEQMRARQAALTQMADTRFAAVRRFLSRQLCLLGRKYRIEDDPVSELGRLRRRIRRTNRKIIVGSGVR